MDALPTLFLSHGAPSLILEDVPARDFLRRLPEQLPRPRAVLLVSAHWETRTPCLTHRAHNGTLHDFSGFPPALYQLTYPAPGDPHLAEDIAARLTEAGWPCALDPARLLDHGAWVPLMLAWPEADLPVVQLSVQSHMGPAHHMALGAALHALRHEGVLIIASGSFTHDLSSWRLHAGAAEPTWVSDFADWFHQALMEQRRADLLDYRRRAPHARRNHPSEEHLLPLFVAYGAAGATPQAIRLHSSTTYSVLRMDAYSFS